MTNDQPFFTDDPQPDDWNQTPDGEDVPASVTFMEIMRQAAAKAHQPPQIETGDTLFGRARPPAPQEASASSRRAAVSGAVQETVTEARPTADESREQRRQALIEEQRIKRIKRRKARRRRQTVGVLGGIVRSFIVVIIAAGLMATIFTWWTPSQFLADQVKMELSIAQATSAATAAPTPLTTPNWLRRVGIVSGHRGPQVPPDPGAVCPDGLTEAEVNFAVAQLVVRNLRSLGYTVDLLDEFDPRLDNYQAAALVSIHANTCQEWPGGEIVSGYLISAAAARQSARGNDNILVECVARYYQAATALQRREGVTADMTDYHTFREIHPLTPAVIIELGFMLADRGVLTGRQEQMARGISDGVICFLEPSNPPPTLAPGA